MDKLSVHQNQIKHSKPNKKKPLKVVYISNPMKFTTSADHFREVVQELTGRDSNIVDLEDRAMKCSAINQSNYQFVGRSTTEPVCMPELEFFNQRATDGSYSYTGLDAMFEMFDEKFTPEVLENFSTLHHYEPCLEANLGEV